MPASWSFTRHPLSQPQGHWLHRLTAGQEGQPTVVLVHGAAGCWHNFRLQIEWLQQHYRVVALDLRGHGLSPWPGPSQVDDFVEDLLQLLQDLPGPLALVAHSFGGCLAVQAALRLGSRVRGLALLNTAGEIPRGWLYRLLQLFSGYAHWVAQFQPYWISCHGQVASHLLWRTLPGWNTWDLAPQISVPTLVMGGQSDPLIPWRSSQRLARQIPGAEWVLIPQGQHVCMWQHPGLVRTHLESWLGRLQWT